MRCFVLMLIRCESVLGFRCCVQIGAMTHPMLCPNWGFSYEHVENPTGKVSDAWAIVRTSA